MPVPQHELRTPHYQLTRLIWRQFLSFFAPTRQSVFAWLCNGVRTVKLGLQIPNVSNRRKFCHSITLAHLHAVSAVKRRADSPASGAAPTSPNGARVRLETGPPHRPRQRVHGGRYQRHQVISSSAGVPPPAALETRHQHQVAPNSSRSTLRSIHKYGKEGGNTAIHHPRATPACGPMN